MLTRVIVSRTASTRTTGTSPRSSSISWLGTRRRLLATILRTVRLRPWQSLPLAFELTMTHRHSLPARRQLLLGKSCASISADDNVPIRVQGHVCPSGARCFHLSKGKCWFKGGQSMPPPRVNSALTCTLQTACIRLSVCSSSRSLDRKANPAFGPISSYRWIGKHIAFEHLLCPYTFISRSRLAYISRSYRSCVSNLCRSALSLLTPSSSLVHVQSSLTSSRLYMVNGIDLALEDWLLCIHLCAVSCCVSLYPEPSIFPGAKTETAGP